MIKFPMKFEVEARAPSGVSSQWIAQGDQLPPIPSAIPPEFMGPGGGYSPEDLFGISVLNCLIALYKVYCEKSKVAFQEIKGKAVLTADKDVSSASFYISHIEIFLDVSGASDMEKARKLLDSAIKDCPISNSIKAAKSFQVSLS
jgi:organic hydroperoxide reductase OsmC/OhrA